MLTYLLKSGICLAVFYLFYKLLLEKEPIHIFKRIYLLGGLLLAFAIPLITFTTTVEVEPLEIINYGFPEIPFEIGTSVQEATPINYWPIILWTIYGFGVVLFGLKFLFNLFQIGAKISVNTKQKMNNFTHILLDHLCTPYTFFSYIFFNKQAYLKQEIPKEVFWHEETHAKQKHSFDIVLIEILQVVFWLNPLLYFIKKDVKLNHEFLADRAVLNKGVSLTAYQEILLAYSANSTEPQLANALNYSSIKKRFKIMKTKTSKKAVWIKSIILLPLVAVLIYGFSEQKVVEIEAKQKTLQSINTHKPVNNIEILINKQGDYLVNQVKTSVENLKKRFDEINPDITVNSREKIIVNIFTNINTRMASITDVKIAIRNYGIKKVNINGIPSVTRQNRLSSKPGFQDKSTYYQNVTFIFRDANKKVLSTKRYTELTDEEKSKLLPPHKVPTKKSPSQNQLNEWGNSKKYGVWLDDVRIENKLLIDISPNEIVLFYNSKLAKNAKNYGKHYYQIDLYTNKKFNEFYKDGIKPLGKGVEIVIIEHSHIKIQRNRQDKATPAELKEYNKIAKHYNAMSKSNMVIKSKDVERLHFIYNKMTEEQKNEVESFPNFPPPPPPPPRPAKTGKKVVEGKLIPPPPPPPIPANATPMQKEKYNKAIENYKRQIGYTYKTESGKVIQIIDDKARVAQGHPAPPPPPPPPPPFINQKKIEKGSKQMQEAFKKFSKEAKLYGASVKSYRTTKKDLKEVENKYKKVLELHKAYSKLAIKEGFSPPPATPPNPTDHMIQMAKKGALFYYEGDKISSDKAIEITKKNKSINIQILGNGSSKPIVKLSKKPITVKK